MNMRSSPGHDQITNEMIRNAPKELIDVLCDIFNICIEKKEYPANLKIPKIPMLLKHEKTITTETITDQSAWAAA